MKDFNPKSVAALSREKTSCAAQLRAASSTKTERRRLFLLTEKFYFFVKLQYCMNECSFTDKVDAWI